jgi:hypothetical protein
MNATAKAKTVVGIPLRLRFAHGLGLLDRRIQIAYFSPIRLERGQMELRSGAERAPIADVSAFVSSVKSAEQAGEKQSSKPL